ncbi:MAG: hypothetical protein ACJ8J0_09150 [Longimicrobiaceae bacterium]
MPIEFEYMLSALFSKERYDGASGHLDAEAWREPLTRIFNHLRKAIRKTVEGDPFHSRRLQERCGAAIDALNEASSCNQLSVTAIEHLTRIAFTLIGHPPEHWEKTKKAAAHPENWRLTKYRTLTYQRSRVQRVAQIIALAEDDQYKGRIPSKRELYQRLGTEFSGDESAFLDWFRSTYPEIYLEVVC